MMFTEVQFQDLLDSIEAQIDGVESLTDRLDVVQALRSRLDEYEQNLEGFDD